MYELNATAARKADSTGSMITELGKYIGTFTQAEDITASTGTKGVALNFEALDGRKARLSLYTKKSTGESIRGLETLMAIMACMGLRNIKPVAGTVKFWDNDANAEATKQGSVFPDLCGKPVGILLETEDYEKKDGGTGTRMVLKSVFQSSTELTASEILDRKTIPEQLGKQVIALRHRPAKAAKSGASQAHQSHGGSSQMTAAEFDEIPF